MDSLIQVVECKLSDALRDAFPSLETEVEVTPATQAKFGHYQCNSAMKLAKVAKMSPREIAMRWAEGLDREIFEKVEVAGPGFINLTLSASFLSKEVDALYHDEHLLVPWPKKKQKVVIDFSSPNIAKEMHVGHLRSTIIGDCLARLFEFQGHEVLRLNHVGDWGTAFGMLIVYMKEEGKEPVDLPMLMEWYRASKKRFDDDERFKERARAAVVALQAGDKESVKLWELICKISRQAFEEVYALLDVTLTERGESFYNDKLSEVVSDLEKKGLVVESEGAKCIFHEGYKIPLMIQKSDGGFNYDTTDMAAMRQRIEDEGADRIIIVTDSGQSQHFELVRLSAEKAGYLGDVRFDHVPFGVVLGEDGKKFRTRSGEVERLIDLLHRAQERAEEILKEREMEDAHGLAQILGIDAVKYADLSCNRVSDYAFSYSRMLRFEGNTAAFILYSYVRIAGIKRKMKGGDLEDVKIELKHPSEIDLGLHLLRFAEVVASMEEDLMPNYLTDYLYQLAGRFNAFFRDCKVVGSAEQSRRFLLCEATKQVLEKGLHILGLKTVDRM
ncbi:MAG: Arginine--tRNA ligase [Chlamydiales bacterium]|nr:Arginine--tRNA ligase [Chlamydiales bacterium]MCH9619331.1 Arginine--tRNA ligase [Chlamydiales bacterium]MCH9622135.1 Arginine--tRNA ligase [Chlamydiales bacterium]